MAAATERAERDGGYSPRGYKLMVTESGSHLEATWLLQSPPDFVHSGLLELAWLGLLDCSAEYHVGLPEFQLLLSEEERDRARRRLERARREKAEGRRPSDVQSRFS
jgi:hypothetical protein